MEAGCLGLIIGALIFGLLGLGIGLLYLNITKAIGLSILTSGFGSAITSYTLYKMTK